MANFKHKKNTNEDEGTDLSDDHPVKGLQRPLKKKTLQKKTLPISGPPPINNPISTADDAPLAPQISNQEAMNYLQDIGERLAGMDNRMQKVEQGHGDQKKKEEW